MNEFFPFDLPMTDPRHPFHVEHMEMALDEAQARIGADLAEAEAALTDAETRRAAAPSIMPASLTTSVPPVAARSSPKILKRG